MRVKVISMIAAVFLSGCLANEAGKKPSELSPDELPDRVAFQDKFTRDFMKSTEEVDDGLYWFESGTGKYEMLIPGDLQISQDSYGTQKNDNAEFFLSSTDSAFNVEIQMEYLSFSRPEFTNGVVEDLTAIVSKRIVNTQPEKIESNDKEIYLFQNDASLLAETDNFIFLIIHIQNKENPGSATIHYIGYCEENTVEKCEEMYQKHEELVDRMIDSFRFTAVTSTNNET